MKLFSTVWAGFDTIRPLLNTNIAKFMEAINCSHFINIYKIETNGTFFIAF
ncbi:hypothetical protein DICPUDRAFT_157494 [Dictyostelium purpureum]|uniref:Uncharacterized protein n=1 Tax=Dictyostelium purpureum TaxID=5786 RepID=F0ZZA0_DICPU|nr:uncharacterized protein DICPUDRAFT_157494 [Dictyostelium purpureum]EGC30732.1 hypothetical protein DICPUDRAFT_157494 [Dictyostelium purpureum]|eukprot:XP_003292743.1 hypothetical protein DICPUDRAFT_157494 [Dictyostelium purpureum]